MEKVLEQETNRNTRTGQKLWPTHRRCIHVYETDKDGVVHFSNYLRIAEEAVFGGFRAIGFPVEDKGNSIAMLNTNVNYYQPIKFGDHVDVVLGALDAKRVRFSLEFDFICEGVLCAQIKLTFTTIASSERRAIPLNKQLRSVLTNILSDSKTAVKQQLRQIK